MSFQVFECSRPGLGDLPDGPVRARQLRQLDLLQVVTDVAPGVTTRLLGDPFEPQRQHGEGDVRMDAMRRPVVDGT